MTKSKEFSNNLNNTLLIDAVIEEDIDQVTKLLESGVTVDKMNNEGTTALMEASFNGNLNIVKLLLSYDADPNLVDKSGLNSFVWAYKAKNFSVLRELLIKVRMWSSDKKFNKTIWKQTLQTFEIYHDVINRMSSYHKISKDIFNNQEIKKNKGIVKYNSMLDELASSSESLKNCFDHDGYYDAPHDSSHWLKNKKAQQKYNSKKNSLRIDFNYGKGKFTPTFMQYKDTQMCAYCQKRCGSACDFEYLKEKKAMNKIRVIGSPTKRYNNITEYDVSA